jgi:hypothetical protein
MIKYILKQPDGSTFPPMTIDELRSLVLEGSVTIEHSIQVEGGKTWHPAVEVAGLLPSGGPVKKQKVNKSTKNKNEQQAQGAPLNTKGNFEGQNSNKVPFIKEKAIAIKETIMKSSKNMAITAGIVLVVLLINFIVFFGGGGINGHLDSLKSASNNMDIAANSGDAYALMESMEEFARAIESMNADVVALIPELKGMNETQGNAMMMSLDGSIAVGMTAIEKASDEANLSMWTQLGNDSSLAKQFEDVQNRIMQAIIVSPIIP